jgi:hypothetical protein
VERAGRGGQVFPVSFAAGRYLNLENHLGAYSDVRRTGAVLSEGNGLLEMAAGYT